MARPGSDFPDPQLMAPQGSDGVASRALAAHAPIGPAPLPMAGVFPSGPEILTGGFNQTWLVNCLRRRWLLASLMSLLVGSAAAALLMWLFPESSRITALLEVKSQDTASVFDENKRMENPQVIERQAQQHLALIRSPMVLEKAIDPKAIRDLDAVQYHLGEEVLWLTNELKVAFAADSPILEVRYEGDEDAEQMKKVINAVVQSYKDNVLLQDRMTQAATQADLKAVLDSEKADLEQKIAKLRDLNEQDGFGTFEAIELPRKNAEIARLENQLVDIDQELSDIEVLKEVALQTAQSPTAMNAAVEEAIDKDPTIRMYQEQLFTLSQAIQTMQAGARNQNNAQLRRLQAQYQQTEAQMAQYRQSTEKALKERLRNLPNEALRAAIAEYKVRKDAALKSKGEVEERIRLAEERIDTMAVGDPKVAMLETDIEGQQELIAKLELKVAEWEVQKKAKERVATPGQDTEYDTVRVIQPAQATDQINKYERWAIAGVGGLGAMALTCYTVALLEFRRRRLNGPQDVDEGLGIRVLGVLPPASLKSLNGNSLVSAQVAEAVDNVRATIMRDSTKRPRQVVMVTSPATMEGSTTVAASLALSLARAGRRTLLVDGDLRAPTLHRLFGLPQEDGLSEVLRSEIDLADAIRPTSNDGLYLLTAGVCDMDAIYALATDQPQAVFDKLRDQFDFIVIDSPPVLGISDALSLGQYIDGAVLTVLRDHSELRRVHQAAETLRLMGVRLIGCVVNGMPVKADRRVARLHQSSSRTPRLPAKVVDDDPIDLTNLNGEPSDD